LRREELNGEELNGSFTFSLTGELGGGLTSSEPRLSFPS
jgi:hypothetical protein